MLDVSNVRLLELAAKPPYPLLFVTVSGAHLYGFPSPDSDYDLRGVHILPPQEIVGLDVGPQTLEESGVRDGIEIDLVTHDARKFFEMMLKKNGYVLEQLHSPLILHTTPEHEELKTIAAGCVTRYHSHHYFGFAETQWKLFSKEEPRRVKPLLYTFRVLLTGIHLMQSDQIEANLLRLNERFHLSYIPDLISRKLQGAEKSVLENADVAFYETEYNRLQQELERATEKSTLPERPSARPALNDLLIRLRLSTDIT